MVTVFFSHEDSGGSLDESFPTCAFFCQVEIRSARANLFYSFFGQDQSTVAQRAKATVDEVAAVALIPRR